MAADLLSDLDESPSLILLQIKEEDLSISHDFFRMQSSVALFFSFFGLSHLLWFLDWDLRE
jgi:hypothetical protein